MCVCCISDVSLQGHHIKVVGNANKVEGYKIYVTGNNNKVEGCKCSAKGNINVLPVLSDRNAFNN